MFLNFNFRHGPEISVNIENLGLKILLPPFSLDTWMKKLAGFRFFQVFWYADNHWNILKKQQLPFTKFGCMTFSQHIPLEKFWGNSYCSNFSWLTRTLGLFLYIWRTSIQLLNMYIYHLPFDKNKKIEKESKKFS